MKLQPVILSGGAGTRLWPLSRESYPKQLLNLTGDHSLLQKTVLRLQGLNGDVEICPEPIVVCNEAYRFITAEQLEAIKCSTSHLILEPAGRNTAPALTLAALHALAEGDEDDAVLLVMPADHAISDIAAFHAALKVAFEQARGEAMVTFGIVPERAETGYGYIRAGREVVTGVNEIEAFVEKPDAATAQKYLESGAYVWNSGLFMVRARAWLQAVATLAPAIGTACEQAYAGRRRDVDFVRVDEAAFAASPSDSIDYAVMERLPQCDDAGLRACVVPLSAGWSDIGSWDALWSLADKDEQGNAGQGERVFELSRNTLVHAEDRMVACVGVEDLVVVETADVVLVAHRGHTQAIKNVVAELKSRGRPEVSAHRKVHRPWGFYDSIDNGQRFQVKRIVVKPGAALSLQMHHHRAEHWIVVRGTARVTRGEESFLLTENQSTYIPLGVTHRLENPGKVALEMIEVQSGSYLGEDDIVRFEDTYGRG